MRRPGLALSACAALLLVALLLGLALGSESISPAHLFDPPESAARVALVDVRLPRVVLGAIAGAGLAAVGVAFQALLRNPLAEPYVLGVSGGSALGATVAILAGLGGLSVFGSPALPLVPLAALLGGVLATALVYGVVRASTGTSGSTILLAGVMVNSIASALITFLKTVVSATTAQKLLFWLTGFLDVQSWPEIAGTALYVACGLAVLARDAGRLNLLALGPDGAAHLGVDVRALERRVVLACSAVVGGIVSLTGLIGFVGLVVPHALRRLIGPDVRLLLPASALAGAAMLVLCDLVSRVSVRVIHGEPTVGAVTALIGGPLFLLLLLRRRRGA